MRNAPKIWILICYKKGIELPICSNEKVYSLDEVVLEKCKTTFVDKKT